jgi:hypothetical protein
MGAARPDPHPSQGTRAARPVAALATGCSGDEPREQAGQPRPSAAEVAPPSLVEDPISSADTALLTTFLDEARATRRVGERFELRDVHCTSRTDAAAEFAARGPDSDSPPGALREHVPGRGSAIVTLPGYRSVGDGVWRFHTSTDHGESWQQTDVVLPLGRDGASQYGGPSTHAVGPGHRQAIAVIETVQDGPSYLSQLWQTNDEREFRRIPLPWERMAFGGSAFASDGALLVSEVQIPAGWYCDQLVCNRQDRIWRLPPDGAEPRLLTGAPGLFGTFWAVGIRVSGGWIVARTGLRTIALSEDGYAWTEVTPGRQERSTTPRGRERRPPAALVVRSPPPGKALMTPARRVRTGAARCPARPCCPRPRRCPCAPRRARAPCGAAGTPPWPAAR